MAVDEAKRARLQARLDKETSKSSLAEKVRRRLRSSRSRNATDDASFRPSIDQRAPDLASPLPPQVKAAKRTPAKMRTLVTSTNDRNMFISGHVPSSKRPVSSSAAAQARRSKEGHIEDATKKTNKRVVQRVSTSLAYVGGAEDKDARPSPRAKPPSLRQLEASRRDWAVMSAFERAVYAREKAERDAERRARVAEQRAALDEQQALQEKRRRDAIEEKAKMARAVAADVARHKAEEEAKADAKRRAAVKTREAREAMLAEARARKEEEEARRRLEEFKMVAEAERLMELDREAKFAKQREAKAAYEATMALNERLNAEKAAARVAAARADADVAAAYQKKLEAEERAREEALKEFHEKIAARAGKAGEAVVANAEAAAKAEVARVRKFEEQREAALAEKERREKESRAAATARQLSTLEAQLAERRLEKRRAKEEDARYAGEVQARVEAAKAAEQEKAAERRRVAVATRLHLEAQMEEKRLKKREQHFDVMGEQERLFNAAILDQASAVVLRGEAFD
jgi:hypothetical protein